MKRYCLECRWLKPRSMWSLSPLGYMCGHPDTRDVIGNAQPAKELRVDPAPCGYTGKLWEPIQVLGGLK